MNLDNILCDDAIQKKQKFVNNEFASFLNSEKFIHNNKNIDLILNFYGLFLGGFYVAKDAMKKELNYLDESIKRMYFSALSTNNLLKQSTEHNIIHNFSSNLKNLNFKVSDYETNLRILKSLSEKLKITHDDLNKEIFSYFFNLNNFLNTNLVSFLSEKQAELLIPSQKNIVYESSDKFNNKFNDELKREHKLDTHSFNFSKINFEDIIGNVDVKNNLRESMIKLFLYNAERKMNPALEKNQFKQKYLLLGEPGNGKGMLAAYAATIGTDIARQKNKKFNILNLENNSSYQDGPIIKLLEHLKKIDSSDETYLIILDEVDSIFTSRLDYKTQNYQKKLVNEILKFTDNSIEYVNKGNYVFVAMTNNSTQLDPAFISRMNKGTYVCEGPKSKDEKVALMKKLVHNTMPENKVLINDWHEIGDIAQALNLSGRDIKSCIDNLLDESSEKNIDVNIIDMSYEEQLIIFNNFNNLTRDKFLDELLSTGERKKAKNYLIRGTYNEIN